ncbi:MAG TPA: DUF5666 domain-containing protein [Ramlibacter sp.]|uniref:DUF5666 domain-containing protein n=1 Tax=Ramlibacter sp. TaxID=1917967 RepID=UPI002D8051F1|nr:DUF5666 domain-containing protein [Ramlibacter sp.]HET8745976.1 DUF5666 domain-containing protein [Ramlibacter sp.]
MKKLEVRAWAQRHLLPLGLAMAVAVGLAACGGGGGGGGEGGGGGAGPVTSDGSVMSSGVITAFGSVFVNGHRFHTDRARVIDDDTDAVTRGSSGLEVGMVVDVKHHGRGNDDEADADELHVHPLARGFVDAIDDAAATLTVMGQQVQLTSGTSFSDRRACVSAVTSPCPAITNLDGLVATTVSGTPTSTVTPGNYVTVHGFLFDGASTDVIATLVSVSDAPTGRSRANFKAEGVATVDASGVSINGLKLDLSQATCRARGRTVDCAGAFADGDVVSAGAAAAPTLPATVLVADFARKANKLPVEEAGAIVEVEGIVSAVSGTSTFTVRGVAIDASGLPAGTTLPKVGDEVRVLGTLSADGTTVQATSLRIEDEADEAKFALKGQAGTVTPTGTDTFTVSVLGQDVIVNARTRLKDVSIKGWERRDPTATPFNITTFQTYLAASVSKTVLVIAEQGAGGTLVAKSLTILPASTVAAISGPVDATPAPVNSTVSGTPTVFFVHGVQVSADPAAIKMVRRHGRAPTSIAPGHQVVVVGTLTGTTIVVGPDPAGNNRVLNLGVLRDDDDDDHHQGRNRGMF